MWTGGVAPAFPLYFSLNVDSYNLYERYVTMTRLNVLKAGKSFQKSSTVQPSERSVAAVIPIEDLHLLERLAREEMDRIDIQDARAALKEAGKTGTIPLHKLMRETGD